MVPSDMDRSKRSASEKEGASQWKRRKILTGELRRRHLDTRKDRTSDSQLSASQLPKETIPDCNSPTAETNSCGFWDAQQLLVRTRKVDLFDLPTDVLLRIFRLGGTILRAEGICQKWRSVLRSDVVFWRNACLNLGIAIPVTAHLARTPEQQIMGYRGAYISSRRLICRHCLCLGYARRYVFDDSKRLCSNCLRLDAYAVLTLTNARRYFAFSSKRMQKVVRERSEKLLTFQYLSQKYVVDQLCTLYRFSEIYALYAREFGTTKANQRANRARNALGIQKTSGEDLKDV